MKNLQNSAKIHSAKIGQIKNLSPNAKITNIKSSKNGKYTKKKIKNGSKVNLASCTQISVSYHTTKKPVNYKVPSRWFGQVKSPLHNYNSVIFQ